DDSDHLGWDALAEQVASLWREVTAGAHDFAAVAQLCRSSEFIFDDSQRWEALAQVERRYRGILDELGFADLDRQRLDHLSAGACRAERDVYLVGLPELPLLARRFLAACTSSVFSLVAAPDELADHFDEAG